MICVRILKGVSRLNHGDISESILCEICKEFEEDFLRKTK